MYVVGFHHWWILCQLWIQLPFNESSEYGISSLHLVRFAGTWKHLYISHWLEIPTTDLRHKTYMFPYYSMTSSERRQPIVTSFNWLFATLIWYVYPISPKYDLELCYRCTDQLCMLIISRALLISLFPPRSISEGQKWVFSQ